MRILAEIRARVIQIDFNEVIYREILWIWKKKEKLAILRH